MEKCVEDGVRHLEQALAQFMESKDPLIHQVCEDLQEILGEVSENTHSISPTPTTAVVNTEERREGKCRICGQTIYWGKHPSNPEQKCPYDADGQIHFATCSAKKGNGRNYGSWEELRDFLLKQEKFKEASCLNNFRVHTATMRDGRIYLRATCECHARLLGSIPMTEQNKRLINAEKDWHKRRSRELYGSSSFY